MVSSGLRLLITLPVLALASCGTAEPPPFDEFTIGPEGGTLSFANGAVVLTFPAGAVSEATRFTFAPATSYPQGPTLLTPTVFDIGPNGLTFGQPVSLRVSFPGATLPTGVRKDELGLYKVVSGAWELNATSTVDTTANTLTASISSLSVFGILGAPAASLEVTPPSFTLAVGGSAQLSAVVRDATSKVLPSRPVSWTSLEPTVASVNAGGVVAGQQEGTARIVGATEGVADTVLATVQAATPLNPACPAYAAPAVPTALRTFYVDGDAGNDAADGLTPASSWRTLGKANASAQPGDEFVLRGTFNNQELRPAVSGTPSNKIVYRAATGQPNPAKMVGVSPNDAAVWLDGRSHVVVDGVEITAASNPVLIRFGASNIWIRNVYVHDAGGLKISQASDNRVEDSRIERIGSEAANAGDAIFIQDGADRNVIVRNTVGQSGHGTIWVSYSNAGEATADSNIIAHNTTFNPWASGMGLNGKASGTIVECNKMFDAADGTGPNYARSGIELEGSGNIIRFNEIYTNGANGITIQGRTFAGFTQNAIGNHIHNNTVFSNGNAGLQIVQKDAGVVQNNIIENNIFWLDGGFPDGGQRYAIPVDLYNANSGNVWPPGEIGGNIVRNNIFPANQLLVLMIRTAANGGNTSYSLLQAQSAFAGWEVNLQADPLFTNAPAFVFRLQAGSPAIDAGRPIPGHPFSGAAPDLGAWER